MVGQYSGLIFLVLSQVAFVIFILILKKVWPSLFDVSDSDDNDLWH